MLTAEQKAELAKPLAKSAVKKNPKGFDYVEGWHAIAEANRIFGFDGWSRETLDLVQLGEPQQVNGNWRVAYRCRVRVTVYAGERIITRDGTGYGSGIVKDIRDAHEGAVKEAETDAMKRALMTFGNPFGLALYDKDKTNVCDDPPEPAVSDEAKQQFISACLKKMEAFDNVNALGEWWKSAEQMKARRDFELNNEQVEALKDAAMRRRDDLAKGKKAA